MALPASGTLSLNDIKTEFNGVNPIAMNAYYRGGAYTTSNNTSVPTSGAISISNFYGASNTVGTTWTQAATYTNNTTAFISVVYGAGRYIAVGSGRSPTTTSTMLYSTDGDTWTGSTAIYSVYTSSPTGIYFVNGTFLAIGGGATTNAAYSTDGITWTPTLIKASTQYGVGGFTAPQTTVWNGTNYINATAAGNVLVSTDLITWSIKAAIYNPRNLVYASGLGKVFGVPGFNGTGANQDWVVSTSNSGTSWATQNISTLLGWSSATILDHVYYNGSVLFVTGNDPFSNPTLRAATSTDGTTWTDVSTALALGSSYIYAAVWGGANWVLSYTNYNVYTSLNLSSITNAPTAFSAMGSNPSPGLATNSSGQLVLLGGGYYQSNGPTYAIKSP